MTDINDIALKKTACPRCEAKPGEDCKTLEGNESKLHAARTGPLEDAFELGRKSATEGNSTKFEEGMPAPRDYANTGETEPAALLEHQGDPIGQPAPSGAKDDSTEPGLIQPSPKDGAQPIGQSYV